MTNTDQNATITVLFSKNIKIEGGQTLSETITAVGEATGRDIYIQEGFRDELYPTKSESGEHELCFFKPEHIEKFTYYPGNIRKEFEKRNLQQNVFALLTASLDPSFDHTLWYSESFEDINGTPWSIILSKIDRGERNPLRISLVVSALGFNGPLHFAGIRNKK